MERSRAMEPRHDAVDAYVKAFRSGELLAAQRLGPFLAEEVVLARSSGDVRGREAVLSKVCGDWPFTPILQRGGWSEPKPSADGDLEVEGVFPDLGAAPRAARLVFSFDGSDKISRVQESLTMAPPPEPVEEIPLLVRGTINDALANGTPMVMAYTGGDGAPVLSLRGSVQVYGPTQLCTWVRNAKGGLASTMAEGEALSLLYRDSRTRTTLMIRAKGHISEDQGVRERVFSLIPEVEQNHDPEMTGAALLIDVVELRGTSPQGALNVQPKVG